MSLPEPAVAPTPAQVRRWRRYLAEERLEGSVYRDLAAKKTGEEAEILHALAAAEGRHEAHWAALLGEAVNPPPRASLRARILPLLARSFGSVFMLALVQRSEQRSDYDSDDDATPEMAADEHIHSEVVRGLAARSRQQLSGSFRAAVFGANDGLVSNLALVIGIGATGVSPQAVLLVGLTGLLAGALSMGAGEYVSVRSQRELLEASVPDPAADRVVPSLDVNANELALVYRARGESQADAEAHAARILEEANASRDYSPSAATAEQDFAEVGTAWQAAISSFCFFAVGAIVPVLPFLLGVTGVGAVVAACLLVGAALCLTGGIVGVLSGQPPLRRALRQLAIGYGAAAVTYGLGLLFEGTL